MLGAAIYLGVIVMALVMTGCLLAGQEFWSAFGYGYLAFMASVIGVSVVMTVRDEIIRPTRSH